MRGLKAAPSPQLSPHRAPTSGGAGRLLGLVPPPQSPSLLGLQSSAKPRPRLVSAPFKKQSVLRLEGGCADWRYLAGGGSGFRESSAHPTATLVGFSVHAWQSAWACKKAGIGSVSGNKVPFLPSFRNAWHPLLPVSIYICYADPDRPQCSLWGPRLGTGSALSL